MLLLSRALIDGFNLLHFSISNLIINNANITVERQYPSKAYTSSNLEITTPFLGKTVYAETIILNTTDITYGSGDYIIYSSSSYSAVAANATRVHLFNYISNDGSGHWAANQYNSADGFYNNVNNNFIKNDYLGDWLVIKLPNPIILTRYRFYGRGTLESRSPGLWKFYGSTDGVSFNEIPEAHNDITKITNTYYSTNGFYEKTLASTFNTSYLYIGFTVRQLAGNGNNLLNFAEFQIFGKEEFNNSAFLSIGTTETSTYSLNVAGSLNASNIYENGSLISSKYLQENSDASKLINLKLENQSNLIFPVSKILSKRFCLLSLVLLSTRRSPRFLP
jgi:hypothetical protein